MLPAASPRRSALKRRVTGYSLPSPFALGADAAVTFPSAPPPGGDRGSREQDRPFRAATGGRGGGAAVGQEREGAPVGGDGHRPQDPDRALHPAGQQALPAPEQIQLPSARQEKQRQLELGKLELQRHLPLCHLGLPPAVCEHVQARPFVSALVLRKPQMHFQLSLTYLG